MNPKISACLALALCACGATDDDARQYLTNEGITVTELKKNGGVFEYTGQKGDDVCTGTLTIKKGMGSASQTHVSQCKRDTSACKPGAAAACVKIADELYSQQEKIFPTTAAELYRVACADGDGRACDRAGEFEGIEKSWAKVREYTQKGCELGNGDACARLGFTELEGNGTEKNEARALELMKKACEKSSMRGCRAAAGILLDATPSDPESAMPLAEKACNAKYQDGCYVYGMALFKAKKNFELALTHFDAACKDAAQKNRGLPCNLAGAILFDGMGMKKDRARAMEYFEKSCEQDFAEGCSNAGNFYKKGLGVPRDADKGQQLLDKACKLGAQEHCPK